MQAFFLLCFFAFRQHSSVEGQVHPSSNNEDKLFDEYSLNFSKLVELQCISVIVVENCVFDFSTPKRFCIADTDECKMLSPCQNGGTCQNVVGTYKCVCPDGYTGFNCEISEWHDREICCQEAYIGKQIEVIA